MRHWIKLRIVFAARTRNCHKTTNCFKNTTRTNTQNTNNSLQSKIYHIKIMVDNRKIYIATVLAQTLPTNTCTHFLPCQFVTVLMDATRKRNYYDAPHGFQMRASAMAHTVRSRTFWVTVGHNKLQTISIINLEVKLSHISKTTIFLMQRSHRVVVHIQKVRDISEGSFCFLSLWQPIVLHMNCWCDVVPLYSTVTEALEL